MSEINHLKHWRFEADENRIAWLYFDRQGASVNTIDRDVMEELSQLIGHLEKNRNDFSGFIIASGKPVGFIAGADIAQFGQFPSIESATDLLREGQGIIQRIEDFSLPSVAMIDGFCLGGGLEIALGCHYRVAEDGPKTRLGLPEVRLGIYPGWGGSVRMPKYCGAIQGLDMVLTGRTVSGRAAVKMGFVDAAVPRRHLVRAARYYVLEKPARKKAGFLRDMTHWAPVRPLLASVFRKKLREKVQQAHYPAPFVVIDNWERAGVTGQHPMELEAKGCGRLFFSETSKNLVRVFFLQERLKSFARNISFSPRHVHVIGAGTMGGDIAAWCALRGMRVTLQDRTPEMIAPAMKRAAKLFREKLKEPSAVQKAWDSLIPDVAGKGVAHADVIIEAIFEDLSAKQALFKQLEETARPDALLATNTSSIPLDEINTVLAAPDRLTGIHFFNPVAKMQLVEVVRGEKTSQHVFDQAIAFVRKIDRLPLPVRSSPGFLVNRILMPYLLEAVNMLDEGMPAVSIDRAMTEFGMPMGPVLLADTVGLDVCLSVAKYLGQYFSTGIPAKLSALVQAGKLGKKSGEGFYQYNARGKQVNLPKDTLPAEKRAAIADRLVLRMLDEAFACLREEVVADADLLDAGMILGTGFAPFRGGPICYAKSCGINELFQRYVDQQQKQGLKKETLQQWQMPLEADL